MKVKLECGSDARKIFWMGVLEMKSGFVVGLILVRAIRDGRASLLNILRCCLCIPWLLVIEVRDQE